MRASVAAVVGGVLSGALLVAAPATARAEEPTVRAEGETLAYADPALDGEDTTRVTGVLRSVVVEASDHDEHADHDGTGTVVVTEDGTVVPVELDLGEEAVSDVPIEADLVAGTTLDRALDGRAAAPVEVAEARVETAQAAAAPTTAHRAYVAVVTNSGAGTLPTQDDVDTRVDGGLAWWTTESGGAISSFTRPAAQVRYASSQTDTCGTSGGAGTSNLWSEAAKEFPGVSFSAAGNHLVVVVDQTCQGLGIGTVGRGLSSGGMVTMREDASVFRSTLVHELGHNVGLGHANYGVAGSAAASVEYRNLYSPMALAVGSSTPLGPPALDTVYRSQLDILADGEVQDVAAGSTSEVLLAPRGSATGRRAVRAVADGTTYWVELRDGSGRDASSFYGRFSPATIDGRTYPRSVAVTRVEPGGNGTRLLAPTSTVAGWTTGQTFTAGTLEVTVGPVTAQGATVTVVNGGSVPTVEGATPTVTGTPRVGDPLTAVPGVWTSGATLAYQWLADGTAVPGATDATFTPTVAQHGRALTVAVTGSRSGYQPLTRTSAPTATVADGTLAGSTPTVSGTPKVGSTLTALAGPWTSGATLTYQWLADGSPVAGATGSTFTPTAAERGTAVAVRVTGSLPGYASRTSESAATAAVAAGTLSAATPVVSGTAKVGVALTATAGAWTSGSALTHQWLVDGADVPGATSSTYTPVAADRGRRVSVRVTGTRDGYETTSRTSLATAAVAAGTLRTATPRVSGTVKVGRRLTVLRGTWTSGTTFTYQWRANGTTIKGATRSTYTLPRSAKGKRITVTVTGRKTGYTTASKVSARTAAVR